MSTPSGLPPIFAQSPVDIVPACQIANFPINTFLESIAVDTDCTLFVTSHLDGKVFRIGADGIPILYAAITGKATGLALLSNGNMLLSAWDEQNTSTVYTISPQGTATVLVKLPDAMFLNGLTPLGDDRCLIADSYRGCIWEVSIAESTARVWLEHSDLARSSSDKDFPAVNGLKVYGGFLYVSNTEKMQLLRIPILLDGQPGEPEIFLHPVNLDDFAFDQDGNVYGTTHVYNNVVKITPSRDLTIIAEAEQGMTGSTALAFGRCDGDRTSIYVITNGGMSLPLPTGIEPAKVVKLDVGIAGHSLI